MKIQEALQNLAPSRALVSHSSSMLNFTYKEIENLKNENYKLRNSYNKLINEERIKQLRLENILTQLAKGKGEITEKSRVVNKVRVVQTRIEQVFEKINKIEGESRRLDLVVTCCLKNPAKNEECIRKLEREIDSISQFVQMNKAIVKQQDVERTQIAKYTELLEQEIQQQRTILNNTIERAKTHAVLEGKVLQLFGNGRARRVEIINKFSKPDHSKYFKLQNKEALSTQAKLTTFKNSLIQQLEEYESLNDKINRTFTEEGNNVSSIIWKFQKNDKLKGDLAALEKKKKQLEESKEALNSRLDFLRQKGSKYPKRITKTFEDFSFQMIETQKKVDFFANLSGKLKLHYTDCIDALQKLWNSLKIRQDFKRTRDFQKETFNKISKSLLEIQKRLSAASQEPVYGLQQDVKQVLANINLYMERISREIEAAN